MYKKMRNINKKIFLFILIGFLFSIIIHSHLGNATELAVNLNSSISYQSIQQAINDASSNDTILISDGIYVESIIIDKPLTIQGMDKSNTTLIPSNDYGCLILSNFVRLQNLSLINASIGVNIQNGSNCTINDITFRNNQYGISIDNKSLYCIIYQNNFIGNTIHAFDEGKETVWSQNEYGNYWDSYSGIDNDSDGIGDTPFLINNHSSDMYPLMQPVTKAPIPHYSYSPLDPTTQTIVIFYDQSYDPDGLVVNWSWGIDNQLFSYLQHPEYQFNDNGYYNISLKVRDNFGIEQSYFSTIEVKNIPPMVSFIFFPEIPLDIDEVEFEDTSFDPDGIIINRTWIINDSIYLYELPVIRYTFPDDGIYQIRLQVRDDDNEISITGYSITVLNVGPIAGFTYFTDNGSLLKKMDIHFKDNSYDADGEITSFFWDFGDGKTSKKQDATHSYDNDGRYKISLTVSDDDGEKDSFSRSINVGKKEEPRGILSGLSLFDILIVAFILAMVVVVIIISKKYS
jgi:PKD repeat protein